MSPAPRIWPLLVLWALFILGIGANATAQSESVLFSFPGGDLGAVPTPGITFHDGSLFGATQEGGAFGTSDILFELSSDGNGEWSENVLHVFQGQNDGSSPPAPGAILPWSAETSSRGGIPLAYA